MLAQLDTLSLLSTHNFFLYLTYLNVERDNDTLNAQSFNLKYLRKIQFSVIIYNSTSILERVFGTFFKWKKDGINQKVITILVKTSILERIFRTLVKCKKDGVN